MNITELLEQAKGKGKDKSGFFDLDIPKRCNDPHHLPPSHLHIPQGKGYRHVCPSCGNVIEITPLQITY